jgi:tetratricopeptide (TPR) repeat protein
MLGFLKRFFHGSSQRQANSAMVAGSEDLDRIEQQLERLSGGRQAARLYNRAGDLYLVQGERQSALRRYGEAIDAYLQAGEYDNAMAVCRKIIRVVPEVIRTRRTLSWLCLGKGFLEIAREHVEAYTRASVEAGLQDLAVQHLVLMARYVNRPDFRTFLADKLEELDDSEAAVRVREGQAKDELSFAGWAPVVFAAMLTPEEIRRALSEGVEIEPPVGEGGADRLEGLLIDPETGSVKNAPPKKGRKGTL